MSRKSDLDRRIQRLERQLEALQPAEPIGVHIQAMDGTISPPLSADELAGRKTCIVAQVVDGRRPKTQTQEGVTYGNG